MLKKFDHVEDYIEYIGGYDVGKVKNIFTVFDRKPSSISLARYDVDIIESFCNQTLFRNLGFTEKQATLAKNIVLKYRKQLEKHGIDMPDNIDNFRLPIRKINNTMSVSIDDNKFVVKFPYNTDLIAKFRNLKSSEDTYARFDGNQKAWVLPLTEYSLNYIKVVCNELHFNYDSDILHLYDQMIKLEREPYRIELTDVDGKLTITNAERSLLEYIEIHIGSIDYSNLTKLVDYSSTLGYTVSDEVSSKFMASVEDPILRKIATNKITKINLGDFDFEKIIEYAASVDRTPVYSYLNSFRALHKFKHDDVNHLVNQWPDSNVPVKLFISQTPVLIGVRKNTMMKTAEKIIIVEDETM